jgi:all-trans-retinol 13,14-reductase
MISQIFNFLWIYLYQIFALLCCALATIFYLILNKKLLVNNKLPKKFSKKNNFQNIPKKESYNRDGYSKKKIPSDIDTIVIGSGIGGLTTAGLLSRVGKKVLVLEQHYISGGCTHCFEDHGYEFDTGIHYIGNIKKRKKVLDLITNDTIEWDKLGREDGRFVYDEIKIGNKEYEFRAGEQNFIDDLVEKFPDEEEAIINYVKLIKKTAKKDLFFLLKIAKPRWLARLISPFVSKDFFEMINKTALEVTRSFTDNEDLVAVLCGQFGDSGPPPSKGSFFMHASVVNHYLEGGWYPRGGTSEIANKIIPVIESSGGRVLVRKAVKKILVENNKAVGVEMSNGDIIKAKNIVSSAGINNTYKNLLSKKYVPDKLIKQIDNIGLSCSFMYLFVGMEGTPTELNLRSSNIWSWPEKDYDKMSEKFYNNPESAPIPLFIGFPCAKDSTWENRFPGKSNAVILTMAKYEWFEKWKDLKMKKRGKDYDDFKKMFEKRILNEGLYKYYPQTKGKVQFTEVGSPLTFNYYIGSTKGEVYGADATPERFSPNDWLIPKTHIDNLYLTGQDITTLGFTGAMMSGILTASEILGYGTLWDIITDRNIINDLDNMLKNKN